MRRILVVTAGLAIGVLGRVASAQQTDVIRGRVIGSDSLPIQGANVRATSYQGAVAKMATTDKGGRYTIIFINGEGDYWIDFTKVGFAPKRYEIKTHRRRRSAARRRADVVARASARQGTGQRHRGTVRCRIGTATRDVGGGERPLTNNGLPPDQAGNLAAMAATVAGIQLIPGLDGAADMYSLLGSERRSEQHHLQRARLGDQRTAARHPRDDVDTALHVRPGEGRLQRRTDRDSDHPGLQLLAPRDDQRRYRAGARVARPDGGGAGADLHEPCAWAETPRARSRWTRCSTIRRTTWAVDSMMFRHCSTRAPRVLPRPASPRIQRPGCSEFSATRRFRSVYPTSRACKPKTSHRRS